MTAKSLGHDGIRLSSRAILVLRSILVIIGLGLIAWAFSGDVRIVGGQGFGLAHATLVLIGVLNLIASTMRVNILLGVLVAQGSIFATLILAELMLRAALSHRYYSAYQLEPRYLYTLVPQARRAYRHMPINGGHEVIYHVNAHGFRGPELATETSDLTRIVVYGDSFIHAEFTELQETFSKQLEAILTARTNQNYEVVNAGVAGYGPDQVLRRVEDELGWLEPDLLIVGIFAGNDFGDLVRNKLYRLESDGTLTPNAYILSDEIALNASIEQHELILKRIARDARNRVRALFTPRPAGGFDAEQAVLSALQQHLDEYQEFVVEGDGVVRELRSDPYSADISLLPGSPSANYKLAKMKAVIERINLTASLQNIPLLVFTIPHPMDLMDGRHESGVVDLARFPDYQPARLTDSVQAIAASHDIHHVNLFPHFREAADPVGLYLRGGDDHWSSEGQRYGAEIVAEYVINSIFETTR